jgi:hypothetical protein
MLGVCLLKDRNSSFFTSAHPTIFLFNYSDESLYLVAVVCEALALLVGAGFIQWPYSLVGIFMCTLSWLSYHAIARDPWLSTFCTFSGPKKKPLKGN